MNMRWGGHDGNNGGRSGHQFNREGDHNRFHGGNPGNFAMPGNEFANQGYQIYNHPVERNHFTQSQNNNFQSELSQSTWNDMRSLQHQSSSSPEHPPLPGRPPEGYLPIHGQVPREAVAFANQFLSQPFGAEAAFEANGKHYMARVEPHYHPPGFQGGPNGWHKGVTLYESIADSTLPPMVPREAPPGFPPEYQPGYQPEYPSQYPPEYPQNYAPGYAPGYPPEYPQNYAPGHSPEYSPYYPSGYWPGNPQHYQPGYPQYEQYPQEIPHHQFGHHQFGHHQSDQERWHHGQHHHGGNIYDTWNNQQYDSESLPYYGNPYIQDIQGPFSNNFSPPRPPFQPYEGSIQPVNFNPEAPPSIYPGAGDDTQAIVSAANADVGESMWACSPFAAATKNGELGCAASVSEVLQQAGYQYANSAGVSELANQLVDHGWQRINVANHPELVRPGDVLYGIGVKPGGSAHICIVGAGMSGAVDEYDNNSATGQWTHTTLDRSALNVVNNSRFENQMWVLRPPQG